jgi:aromatic-L-amino-acid/L-tryptophan decarboxylase
MTSLDPGDWMATRALGHRMLDDMFDYLEHIRERPAWQPIPASVRGAFRAEVPNGPTELATVYREFTQLILPYSSGNVHPAFLGWVQGGGTVTGMLAEMLAGGLNANLGGRDHVPIEVERQIAEWMRRIFGFPEGASGLFVTGTSIANFMALLIARKGAASCGKQLVAYTSAAAHGCIARGMEMSGLGRKMLRNISTDARHRIRISELRHAILADRKDGLTPFLIVGTAGTVDIGAIDDLKRLSDLAAEEGLWLHIDGACGALAILAPDLASRLKGIERADSIAFDFHKWGQVPYDAGFLLVRDGSKQLETFAAPAAYLRRELRGTAGGSPWPCDFGPDLSRGFRALKTWFTLKVYGTARIGAVISETCRLAQYLMRLVQAMPQLELAAPVQLNIVCFRYCARDSERVNAEIVIALQESGIAVPSTTLVEGRLAIRAAIVNHRTRRCDLDSLIAAVVRLGREIDIANWEARSPGPRATPHCREQAVRRSD